MTPIITINNPIVLVKRSYTNPKRQPVVLQTDDATFDGSGTLNISPSGTINFFDAATGGNAVADGANFRGGQLGNTVTIFAEGANPSTAMNDVTLTLTLTPGTKPVKPPATATMTLVRVTLDICMSRTTAGSDPTPLSQGDKINVGRPLHVHDTGNHHGRALLIIRKAEPDVFPGNLVLNPLNANVAVFAETDEVPAGQTALGRHTIANGTIDKTLGAKRWAEGASVSGALRDTGFQLGVDGVDDDGDQVKITAVMFSHLKADIPSTPAKTSRLGNSPVARHTLEHAVGAPSASDFDEDFITNPSVVLMTGSVLAGDPINLSVQVTPAGVPVNWKVLRDGRPAPDGDHANVKAASPNPVPTINPSGLTATFLTDATGSFHVCPFVDCNGNGSFDYNDPATWSRID